MQHKQKREPSPTPRKPPRPPPLSVSIQPDPDPPTRPEPKPQPHNESPHSPLRSDSPHRSDEDSSSPIHSPSPSSKPHNNNNNGGGGGGGGAIVAVEKYYSPLTSPLPVTPPKDSTTPDSNFPPPPLPHHIISFNRREEAPPRTGVVYGAQRGGGGGGGERKGRVGFVIPSPITSSPHRSKKEEVVNKVGLGMRVLEIAFCLVSFAVMASDKTQGWSGDSFDRYKEYRFCLTVTILGCVYSGFQAAFQLTPRKHAISHKLRCQFDFIMDQILAYLLISASSAAASRVDDWQSNWGKDAFTEKASASISMAFLAFIAFAISSLISGYNLCNRDVS